VTLLEKLDINTPIPLEAYAAVAEILAYVYKANDKARSR
jgi:type III secretion system FlhB-like substrate exporter